MKNNKYMDEPIKSPFLEKPKYAPGDVIDLSYKMFSTLPNRIYIQAVYCRIHDSEWMYSVLNEATGAVIPMNEGFINERITKHKSPVYKTELIKGLINDGYRFAGNFPDWIAEKKAKKIAYIDTIHSILLYNALDPNGNPMDGYKGIWVKYTTVIHDNGNTSNGDLDDVIKIK